MISESGNGVRVPINRSYPLATRIEEFRVLEYDPRPIDEDLNHVLCGFDPRAMSCIWQEMEKEFCITRAHVVKYLSVSTRSAGSGVLY